jgi:ActR/RegA family two-component response regulator
MATKVLLVGHCGPDASYLHRAVKSALGDVAIEIAEDNASMQSAVAGGVDLVLINRELGYGFEPDSGVEMIRALKQANGNLRLMLVSNFAEAQKAAVEAGAFMGFGKRQIGSAIVTQVLQNAVAAPATRP